MIPEKREDLLAMGYEYLNDATCRGCRAPIEWWLTPRKKKMPMTVKEVKEAELFAFAAVERWIRIPHFGECPALSEFRRPKQ
jgi:hypothetical protein